jgi:predicted nucleic-acid-binding protein
MRQRTNIQIERATLLKLKRARITKRETYDEIINRLLNDSNFQNKTQ